MNSVFASVHAKLKLSVLQTYCASWHGCQVMQLGTPNCNIMNVKWRKQLAGLLVCPGRQRASCFLVWRIYEKFLSQQEGRFARLFNTVSAGRNPVSCFLATRASLSSIGALCRNGVYLAKKYQCGRLSKDLLVPPWRGAISVESPSKSGATDSWVVRARDGLVPIDILEPEDMALVLEFITTYWINKYI